MSQAEKPAPPTVTPLRLLSGEPRAAGAEIIPRAKPLRSGSYRVVRASDLAPEIDRDDDDDRLRLENDATAAEKRMCDTVHLEGSSGQGVVHLVEGEVAWIEARGFGLPSFRSRLVSAGLAEQHEVDLVVALCKSTHRNFAQMLMELELVDEAALVDTMREHVRDAMQCLLSMREMTGRWTRGTSSFTGDLTIPLDDVLTMNELERWALIIAHAGGSATDRRIDNRVPLHALASVETPRGQMLMMSENLSHAGALLRSPCVLELGAKVVVKISIGAEKLTLPGRVVRLRRGSMTIPQAIAVSWDLDDEARVILEAALETL